MSDRDCGCRLGHECDELKAIRREIRRLDRLIAMAIGVVAVCLLAIAVVSVVAL